MSWRLARSLQRLEDEIQQRYPGTTVWDIGDEDHQNSSSDHNPNNRGVVCAIDVLGDGGMNLQAFVDHLVEHRHRALRYVIYNRRIWSRRRGYWRRYSGKNAHKSHAHVSVGNGPDGRSTSGYDYTDPWGIASMGHGSAPTSDVPAPTLREGDSGYRVGQLQAALNDALGADLAEDEDFGPATAAAVAELQARAGITVDEIYGPDTAGALSDLLEEADMPSLDDISFAVWNYTNEKLTTRDAYAYLRGISADLAAARKRDEAILAAVQGVDGEAILARIDQRSAEDAERDAALLSELRGLASGGATAEQIVDQLAERIAAGGK